MLATRLRALEALDHRDDDEHDQLELGVAA
jgi:hypothetical protein